MGGCGVASDCPGNDTDCQARSCDSGVCGVMNAAMGKVVTSQPKGDCQQAICDGSGDVTSKADDTDVPDDGNDCTIDGCASGAPTTGSQPASTACNDGGGVLCDGLGACVECIANGDCMSQLCDQGSCVAASCGDMVKNGTESDVDCGGTCTPCSPGQKCVGASDCLGGFCAGGFCQATCSDTLKDNAETDVDCGGPSCAGCALGKACVGDGDCATGACKGGACVYRILISEVRSRGLGGASDEFIELYNPTVLDVVLDATWKIESRSHSAANYAVKWTGAGVIIPSHGHFLITGATYVQMPTGDATLSSGITDAGSIRLLQGGAPVDAVCYSYSAMTLAALTADPTYTCEGAPVSNLPHNDGTSVASTSDASIERKPGGAAGNGTDTNVSSADFQATTPAIPQNRMSATTP